MDWNPVPTELTTGATDAVLALVALGALLAIRRGRSSDPWRVDLWSWILGLLVLASLLGAVAHSLDLTERTRDLLWQPLYLSLGLVVALFAVAAIRDRFGESRARLALPWALVLGIGFYVITRLGSGTFLVFIAYEAAAMVLALALYLSAALRGDVAGAWLMTAGVFLSLAAAAVQQSAVELEIGGIPLDHNGVFHLIQII